MAQNRLFEQPMIYVVFGLALLLLEVLYNLSGKDETIGTARFFLLILYLISLTIYLIFKEKGVFRINSVSGNTGKSLFLALIMLIIILGVSTFIGLSLGYAKSIWAANSLAMVGAIPQFIFLNNPLIVFIIVVFFISTLETIVYLQVVQLIMHYNHISFTLSDYRTWIVLVISSTAVLFYHAYSKFIPLTGEVNVQALIVVFVLFTICGALAIKQKEMESSIYVHIGNNFLAMAYKLKEVFAPFLAAFGISI